MTQNLAFKLGCVYFFMFLDILLQTFTDPFPESVADSAAGSASPSQSLLIFLGQILSSATVSISLSILLAETKAAQHGNYGIIGREFWPNYAGVGVCLLIMFAEKLYRLFGSVFAGDDYIDVWNYPGFIVVFMCFKLSSIVQYACILHGTNLLLSQPYLLSQ